MRFVGVSGQDDLEEMDSFVTEFKMDGFEHVADLNGQLWTVFGVTAQPSFIFINDDGTITRKIGAMQPDALEEQLQILIDT